MELKALRLHLKGMSSRAYRIHSMELKGVAGAPGAMLTALANPFNGIESRSSSKVSST